jgi:uncharacterized protein (DUF736 family)
MKDQRTRDEEGTGVLFEEQAEGNRPNHRGYFFYKGVKIYWAGWNRESKMGKRYISLKVDERANKRQENTEVVEDSDIPFDN